jgi:Putative transposase DNA-binding domain
MASLTRPSYHVMLHVCGFINHAITLRDRLWTCPCCGTIHQRDQNAAASLTAPLPVSKVAVRPPRWLRPPEERIPQALAVGVRQLGYLLNMMKPQLSGVLQPARAVSARTVTCRGPAVPRSCSRLSEKRTARLRPVPLLPPLERKGCGPSTRMSSA